MYKIDRDFEKVKKYLVQVIRSLFFSQLLKEIHPEKYT